MIRAFTYNAEFFEETTCADPQQLAALRHDSKTIWVDVDDVTDPEVIAAIGAQFGLHPLALEDVLHQKQRAKVEPYPGHTFIVVRMPMHRETLYAEQVCLFVGADFIVSFQTLPGDCLDTVRQRLRKGQPKLRQGGPDQLAYELLDAIIDSCFPLLEKYAEELEEIEEILIAAPQRAAVQRIYLIRRDLQLLRRCIWPLRDELANLLREPGPYFRDDVKIYLRDCQDHAYQLLDLIENDREMCASLVEIYHASMSNRTNEVMKVLTVMTSIFIPLTFIVGIYGMNFDPSKSPLNMPELQSYWGYPICLAVMAIIAGSLLLYFRNKGWIGDKDRM